MEDWIAQRNGFKDINALLTELDRAGTPGSKITPFDAVQIRRELNDLR